MKGVGWLTGEVAYVDCEVCEIVQANGAGSNDTARESVSIPTYMGILLRTRFQARRP